MIPFVKTENNVTVYLDDNTYVVGKDHPRYRQIIELLTNVDETYLYSYSVSSLKKLLDFKESLSTSLGITITNQDEIIWQGYTFKSNLTNRIINLIKSGEEVESVALINFFKKLSDNSSRKAVTELFDFLEACTLPITSDGCFLAYKKVAGDYKSIHVNPDGTYFDNSVGNVVSMPRSMVDDDSEQTCSTGLHVCSFGYLSNYSSSNKKNDRVVIVKIDPKNVVSVPSDYNNQKMRVCEYFVVGEVPLNQEMEDTYISTRYDDLEEVEEESYDDPFEEEDDDMREDYSESFDEPHSSIPRLLISNHPNQPIPEKDKNDPTAVKFWGLTHVKEGETTKEAWLDTNRIGLTPQEFSSNKAKSYYAKIKNVPYFSVRVKTFYL